MSYAVRLMGQRPPQQQQLIRILQAAYSGEMAAAYAYRGHWKSLKNAAEKVCVQRIEDEEWVHREKVGRILDDLQSGPLRFREIRMLAAGRTIGMLCHFTGWFLPMYFAGRIESRNVCEYETAATHARKLGLTEFEIELRTMASVEREHEVFFMNTIAGHRLLPLMRKVFGWG
jgi:demethoxyubiquinone hydroxylase (CLK1/Coq7/Cat5 family)